MKTALPVLLVVLALAACAAPPVPASDPVQAPRRASPATPAGFGTMLKLKDPKLMLEDKAQLDRLVQVAGAPIELVRRMSGDAYVIRLVVADEAAYRAALARLRANPSVEYVEPDQVLRTQ